jgi:glycosyltransferase involved in cell wall biosynthesis
MRNVLIICYEFSDINQTGALRVNGLAKFLPNFGWRPVILTATSSTKSASKIEVIEADCEDLIIRWKRRLGIDINKTIKEHFNLETSKERNSILDLLLFYWYDIFAYPDRFSGWRDSAVKSLDELISIEHFDAMISSVPPWTGHLIACDIKKKYNIPWIADFRDLWSQSTVENDHTRVRHFFDKRLEKKTLSFADTITTVSQPHAEILKPLHTEKKVYSIPNGFDPSQKNPGTPLSEKFTITHTGFLYGGTRDPEPLFKAISSLVSSGLIDPNDLSIEFYGVKENWLEEEAKKYGLEKIVKSYGVVSRETCIQKQRQSHMLLHLSLGNAQEKGHYSAKVFDYLAAERPILSIGLPGDVADDLINKTGSGFHGAKTEDLMWVILGAYNEYKSKMPPSYDGIPSEIDKYSHVEMARKFSLVLDEYVN